MSGRELRALRTWLAAQVIASVVANWLGAEPTWEARVVALPAPFVLFGSIESMLRFPGAGDLLSWCRGLGTIAVGGAAGFLSFRHIGALGELGGLTWEEQIALVITLDGGMLVVALTLLMVHKRERPTRRKRQPQPKLTAARQPSTEPVVSLEVLTEPEGLNETLTKTERQDLVVQRYHSGDTAAQMAELAGVGIRTIRRDWAELREAGRLPQVEAPA